MDLDLVSNLSSFTVTLHITNTLISFAQCINAHEIIGGSKPIHWGTRSVRIHARALSSKTRWNPRNCNEGITILHVRNRVTHTRCKSKSTVERMRTIQTVLTSCLLSIDRILDYAVRLTNYLQQFLHADQQAIRRVGSRRSQVLPRTSALIRPRGLNSAYSYAPFGRGIRRMESIHRWFLSQRVSLDAITKVIFKLAH